MEGLIGEREEEERCSCEGNRRGGGCRRGEGDEVQSGWREELVAREERGRSVEAGGREKKIAVGQRQIVEERSGRGRRERERVR